MNDLKLKDKVRRILKENLIGYTIYERDIEKTAEKIADLVSSSLLNSEKSLESKSRLELLDTKRYLKYD